MRKKRFQWLIIALMLCGCMTVGISTRTTKAKAQLVYGTNGTITRAEWVHDLVTTFDMTMSEGLKPDNYYKYKSVL